MTHIESKDSKIETNHVIFYKGHITEVVDDNVGIYVVDDKILLFITISNLPEKNFNQNDEIFLSNVHFLIVNDKKFLIGCALSFLQRGFASQKDFKGKDVDLLEDHYLCFPDLFSKDLFINFNPYIVKQFLWNSFYKCRSKFIATQNYERQNSLSKWHSTEMCAKPFTEDYDTPSIAFLLSEAKKRIIWNKHSSSWDHCVIQDDGYHVLVGFLHLARNGCLALSDSQSVIQCVFIDLQNSSSESKTQKLICEVLSGTTGYYVALKKYGFIFEKILDSTCKITEYLCISLSNLIPLEKLFKKSSKITKEVGNSSVCSTTQNNEKTLFSQSFTNSYCMKTSPMSSLSNTSLNNQSDVTYILLEFEVINKMWSLVNKKIVFSKALVVLFSEQQVLVNNGNFTSFMNLSQTFDKKESDELLGLMKNLNLNSEYSIMVLNFSNSSSKLCASLQPQHKYQMFMPCETNGARLKQQKAKVLFSKDTKMNSISVDNTIKIIHSTECFLQDKNLKENVTTNVQKIHDILLKKDISKEDRIKGILLDKSFEKDFNSEDKILRLVLKDLETADTIKVFIFHYPDNLYGLLPNVTLELTGFVCVRSQNGNLYLRSTDSVGLHTFNLHNTSTNVILSDYADKDLCQNVFWLNNLNSANCPVKFNCFNGFVLKITYAHIFPMCVDCLKCIEHHCKCSSDYQEVAEVSFDVDDGSHRVTMHGRAEILKFLLNLSDTEWNALVKHVMETKECLKFLCVSEIATSQSYMNKLFYYLCTSHTIKRPVSLRCYLQQISDGKQLTYSCICQEISEIDAQDIAAKLYLSLTK